MQNTSSVKEALKNLGFKASDFSVKSITGFATSARFSIKAKTESLTKEDFAKVEAAFPFGFVMVWSKGGSTMIWN